jgi:flagellar hook-associated protein 1 FlgK
MAISSFYGLQTTLRGLLAHQRSLDVTSHNIANVSTPGYSRQSAELVATQPMDVAAGAVIGGAGAQLGTGVDVQQYKRVRDTFLDLQYRAQSTKLGEATAKTSGLQQAQDAINEPSETGVNAQLSTFWKAWSTVSNNPDDLASRTALVQSAGALTDAFGAQDTQLAAAQQSAQAQLDEITGPNGELSQLATKLGDLNATIKNIVGQGEAPNDLLDTRDKLLDQLSSLGQTSVEDNGDGTVKVTFGGAGDPPLVDGATVNFPPPMSAPGGKIGALTDLAKSPGGTIATMRADLNAVVKTLADAVNAIHSQGGGGNFFSYTPGSEAGSLAVAVTPAGVRATTTGSPGGNELARQISELRGGAGDSAYAAFVSKTGAQVQAASAAQSNAQALTDSVDQRRQSVSGVSLDEEMTNLVRFQRGYQASARAMSTMDEMLDVLINRTGRVGL